MLDKTISTFQKFILSRVQEATKEKERKESWERIPEKSQPEGGLANQSKKVRKGGSLRGIPQRPRKEQQHCCYQKMRTNGNR